MNDHMCEKELFIRFTVRVFRERLSIFVCVLLPLLVSGWDVEFDCINSWSLSFYLLCFLSIFFSFLLFYVYIYNLQLTSGKSSGILFQDYGLFCCSVADQKCFWCPLKVCGHWYAWRLGHFSFEIRKCIASNCIRLKFQRMDIQYVTSNSTETCYHSS